MISKSLQTNTPGFHDWRLGVIFFRTSEEPTLCAGILDSAVNYFCITSQNQAVFLFTCHNPFSKKAQFLRSVYGYFQLQQMLSTAIAEYYRKTLAEYPHRAIISIANLHTNFTGQCAIIRRIKLHIFPREALDFDMLRFNQRIPGEIKTDTKGLEFYETVRKRSYFR